MNNNSIAEVKVDFPYFSLSELNHPLNHPMFINTLRGHAIFAILLKILQSFYFSLQLRMPQLKLSLNSIHLLELGDAWMENLQLIHLLQIILQVLRIGNRTFELEVN